MSTHRKDQRQMLLIGTGFLIPVALLGLGLWARYGEGVYFDRLMAGIAGCF